MEAKQLLWFCSGSVRLVRRIFWVCQILYNFCLIRRPWFKQGFGQSAAGTKCGPTDLPEGGHECPLWSGEPTQWVSTSLHESPFNISLQSSTQWNQCWKTAARPVWPGRSVSAANANAAQAAATSATAALQTLDLMLLLPGSCYPPFHQNTCRSKNQVLCFKISFAWVSYIQGNEGHCGRLGCTRGWGGRGWRGWWGGHAGFVWGGGGGVRGNWWGFWQRGSLRDLRAVLVHPTLPTLSNSCVKKGNLDTLPVIVRLTLLATKLLREINDNK